MSRGGWIVAANDCGWNVSRAGRLETIAELQWTPADVSAPASLVAAIALSGIIDP
jgi:hypothetical protein